MARYKTLQRSTIDERAFPIRVLIRDPGGNTLLIRFREAEAWLNDHVGRGQWAVHGAGNLRLHARAFYFRTAAAAERFLQAHPGLELSDRTDAVAHIEAERNPKPHFGWHDAAHLSGGRKS